MDKYQISNLIELGTYKGNSLNGKLIETHISWVILTKKFTFKIKKKMHYSFLNYSSLNKRKFYCEKELLLNGRVSDIYLDVLPVKQGVNNLYIGKGKGKIVDYSVRMKRMQIAKQMNHLLQRALVSKAQIDVLAKKIAAFHQGVDIVYNPFKINQSKKEFNDILGVAEWIKANLENRYFRLIRKAVRNSDAFLDQNKNNIENRIKKGFWRDGHGDLHSKNIFLYRDPIIFDCIEFNDSFRQIDVLNEVAFLCMDLEAFKYEDLSKRFMKTYLEVFPCREGYMDKRLFTYYKSYRANVRAKVNTLRAIQTNNSRIRNEYIREIKKYLNLMDHYDYQS